MDNLKIQLIQFLLLTYIWDTSPPNPPVRLPKNQQPQISLQLQHFFHLDPNLHPLIYGQYLTFLLQSPTLAYNLTNIRNGHQRRNKATVYPFIGVY